jgi:iron complex transport system ATP-binding protein
VHLDISHQIETLELVRKLNTEGKITVMAAMHDLNLASLYFDRLILLDQGHINAQGTPAQVLTEDRIREIFNASVRIEPHPATGVPHIIIMPGEHE